MKNLDRNTLLKGMAVYDTQGTKLGKVADVHGDSFTVEKGFFFPEEKIFRLNDIESVSGDEIRVASLGHTLVGDDSLNDLGRSQGATQGYDSSLSASAVSREGADAGLSQSRLVDMQSAEVVVPVIEEEVVVEKTSREVGQLHIRKEVVTEMRSIEVPVTREEVIVERVAVDRRADGVSASAFQEEEIVVPVREDEVIVTTRPVVREEVRIRKEAVADTFEGQTSVKKERVEVESKGDIKRKQPVPPGPVKTDGQGSFPSR